PELSSESFSDPEVLAQGRIVVKEPRPEERIARHRSEGPRRRTLPGTARAAVRIQYCGCCGCCGAALPAGSRRGGGEPGLPAGLRHARVAHQIRAVRPCVCVTPKVSVGRCERQAGTPEGDARELPAADQVINRARSARQELVSLAKRQFVNVVKVDRKPADPILATIINRRVP